MSSAAVMKKYVLLSPLVCGYWFNYAMAIHFGILCQRIFHFKLFKECLSACSSYKRGRIVLLCFAGQYMTVRFLLT